MHKNALYVLPPAQEELNTDGLCVFEVGKRSETMILVLLQQQTILFFLCGEGLTHSVFCANNIDDVNFFSFFRLHL